MHRFIATLIAFAVCVSGLAAPHQARADEEGQQPIAVEMGPTGYDARRLVLASACPHACPWGELGEFLQEGLAGEDLEIILCRNCNRAEGPRLVARASFPPQLIESDFAHGTHQRVHAPVDFGVTEASMLTWAYEGRHLYSQDGPYRNLRLIARIEDPTYLLVAVKSELAISSLAEIRERRLPVRIVTDLQPSVVPVLDFYGLDRESVESWGGALVYPRDIDAETPFDIVVSTMASPANNPESEFWTTLTAAHELTFLDLPDELLDRLVAEVDMVRTVARWGILRGVDRPIETVGRSGEVFFARDDMPDELAYEIARAIDRHRSALKWFARPYSLDPLTVGEGNGVPLHPGAEQYYRDAGYLH